MFFFPCALWEFLSCLCDWSVCILLQQNHFSNTVHGVWKQKKNIPARAFTGQCKVNTENCNVQQDYKVSHKIILESFWEIMIWVFLPQYPGCFLSGWEGGVGDEPQTRFLTSTLFSENNPFGDQMANESSEYWQEKVKACNECISHLQKRSHFFWSFFSML